MSATREYLRDFCKCWTWWATLTLLMALSCAVDLAINPGKDALAFTLMWAALTIVELNRKADKIYIELLESQIEELVAEQ
ncbi:hypothetical protein LITTLEE_114 [Mycobacterium phage LittleE]|uniref:Uncharacterized protein n=1 Tax=Mycobacterium phage LittleE TaxID=2922212 RepID=G1D3Z9_9CAUD|nr:NrdH [Mycobacterium phage LittleE]AEK09494.1 hypothetical protein LITTLEE_114 [Mycobacterium phage LittleE]